MAAQLAYAMHGVVLGHTLPEVYPQCSRDVVP